MATTVLSVPAISCSHCENTISGALTPLTGVSSVRVDIPTKKVTVEYDPSAASVARPSRQRQGRRPATPIAKPLA